MSAAAEEITTKIDEIYDDLAELNAKLHGALQGAVDKIFSHWYVPDWLKERAEDKAQEAYEECKKIQPKMDPAVEWAIKQINDYNSVRVTGPQYCAVDFSTAADAVGTGTLGPRGDDWTSGNTVNYRNAVQSLPTKLQNLRDAVEDICEILSDLKGDYESYFIGLLLAITSAALAIAGLVLAVIGLILSIPSGGAGLVVAIISVVVAAASAVVAGIAFAVLPDMGDSRATSAERLQGIATSVRNSPWPAKPALDSGDWR